MYTLSIKNPCSCFIKRGLATESEFASKEEVKAEAEASLAMMEKEFCKKHTFILTERFGDYTINIRPR